MLNAQLEVFITSYVKHMLKAQLEVFITSEVHMQCTTASLPEAHAQLEVAITR